MPYYAYILANKPHGTLYIGVTNNLERRIGEHQFGIGSKFATKYKVHHLVYFEETTDPQTAIAREKQIKSWKRRKKIELIESLNPNWVDLTLED